MGKYVKGARRCVDKIVKKHSFEVQMTNFQTWVAIVHVEDVRKLI